MLCLQAAFTGIPSSHNRWTWRQVLPKELPTRMEHLIRPEVIGVLNGKVGLVVSSSTCRPPVSKSRSCPSRRTASKSSFACGRQSIPSAEYVLASLTQKRLVEGIQLRLPQSRHPLESPGSQRCIGEVTAGPSRSFDALQHWSSALEHGRNLRPVLGEPLLSIGRVDDAVERSPGGILERLLPQPGGGIVDQLVQPLVARTRLKGICNPDAGPILIGLAKPWCRVELKRKSVIGCMTLGSSRLSRIGCPRGHLNTPYCDSWRALSENRDYRLSFSRPRSRQSQVKS
jgi:hypothetical protein